MTVPMPRPRPSRPAPGPKPFSPHPWLPLTGPLFEVNVPGRESPAGDHEWYRLLTTTTGLLLQRHVELCDHTFKRGNQPRWNANGSGKAAGFHDVLSRVFFEGEITADRISKDVGRLVKTVRLVVYNQEPGTRQGWPMAVRLITLDEGNEIADRAYHGNYTPIDPTAPEQS